MNNNESIYNIVERVKEIDKLLSTQSERMEKMNNMMREMMDKIEDISSEKLNNEAVASMREKYTTYE